MADAAPMSVVAFVEGTTCASMASPMRRPDTLPNSSDTLLVASAIPSSGAKSCNCSPEMVPFIEALALATLASVSWLVNGWKSVWVGICALVACAPPWRVAMYQEFSLGMRTMCDCW